MFLYIKIHHSSKLVERLKSDVNAVYSFVVYFRSILNSKMADKNEDSGILNDKTAIHTTKLKGKCRENIAPIEKLIEISS